MNINYKEPQFELFPANSATLEDINKPRFLLATLTLSIENLVILVILGIMIALFSFSIGVERGRSVAAQSLDEKVAAAWNVGGRRLAAVTPIPQAVVAKAAVSPVVKSSSNGSLPRTNSMLRPSGVAKAVVVAKSAPVLVASPVVAAVGNKWTVQVSTYKSEKYAQQAALGFKAKGYPVFLVKSKDFFLVCIGQFASQAQADSFFKKNQAKYQSGQVRRI